MTAPPTLNASEDPEADRALVLVLSKTLNRVVPLHRGHHPVWDTKRYHLDICNMVDDVVVCDLATGHIYRFPINFDLLPWLNELIAAMKELDRPDETMWGDKNVRVREAIMAAVRLVLDGVELPLYIFEPGAINRSHPPSDNNKVETMLRDIIAERGDEAFVR